MAAVCPRCSTENPETAKFCSECGSPLAAAQEAREHRKTVTALFCDVTGSTALGERIDPEALRGVMARYYEQARAAIERHGGTVEKFIGDAVMAVFGIPVVHEDDAIRALRAAVELRDAVDVDVRIGVNTGEVVTGGGETLATGDALNVAARLEQAAGAGEILLGGHTYALVRDAVDAELLPPIEAKGKSQALTVYRLRGIAGETTRRDGAPMVGRERELDLLGRAHERAVHERACHLFTILGSAGIGKSRLVSEFLARLDDARVVQGRCLSYGEGITYWPVVEVLNQLDVPVDSVLRDGTSPGEIAWAVRRALEQAALERPLVVVFDDIQWGEPLFLDLIEHVADLSRGAPLLLLCMARPDLLDARRGWGGGKLNATSVLLEPLPQAAVEELLRALTGAVDERIRSAADGNPLFVEEMVELARTREEVATPPTIQALLAARLDSLPAEERLVLECASVAGQTFHRRAVTVLARDGEVDGLLASLVRKDLIRPEPDDTYRFRHLLIRDAAYESVSKATRIDLHERFATWLEEQAIDIVELEEIIGYHLEQAAVCARELERDPFVLGKRAAIHLTSAAIRVDAWGDVGAAAKLGLRAERLVERDDPRRILLLPLLARTLDDCGRSAEALPLLDEAIERGDLVTSARARAIRATVRGHAEGLDVDWCFAELRRALDDLAGVDDDDVLADVTMELAWLTFWAGRMTETSALTATAREHAARSGNRRVEVQAIGLHAGSLARGRTPLPEVEAVVEEMLALESLGPALAANALFFRSRCLAERGEINEARTLREEAIRRMEELGLTIMAPGTHQLAAMYEWLVPDWDEMERNARIARDRLGEVGEVGIRAGAGALLAVALTELGRDAEAATLVEQVTGVVPNDYMVDLWLALARSRLAANGGDYAAAVEHARQAIASTDGTDESFMRLMALIALAEMEAAAGDSDGAAATIDGVVAEAEHRQSPAFLARARTVLATMPA